ncbi:MULTISPECIES: hypothetical protein [Elizabethkingia]|uniref:hypothetical protein n=1 Tax=Elizabethkingia TaxID=308865 RepID=UPI0024E1DC31|nr:MULTISPECIES: hypothetical protein [Elizabethkingia]MDX8555901.1 hypothetical protein [Elizabethkingia sp. HX CGY]CAH1149220.1 hypothetical protein EAVNVB490_03300 [Elizabethkingia anophelis]CAI9672197.1 hypothetical protein EAVNNN508_03295 [Elizabethkingia anophelis]CAI9674047.1 hypothetical protein EAVNVB490_01422 [Elizabethkingia anophelis]CAI9680655.1 hypothetical protein EAVNNN508_01420 [Elizabethkingia anophelis]
MGTTTNTENTARAIISDNRQIIARAIISGNTVTFNYNYVVNPQKPPFVITFSVQRGKTGDQDFTGNYAMTGSYFPENDKFQFEVTGSKPGDETLRESILNECKAIIAELTVIN